VKSASESGQTDAESNRAMFIENLKRAGHAVEAKGPVVQPFLSVPGQFVSIDGSDVQTFEYDSEKAAKAAVAKIAPDGSTVGDTRIGWVEPPHFFRKGRLLVLYVGKNEQVTRALKPVLGDQIAGK
jgi:membrane-associated protease RseP (regulator of RpoE activity)